MNARKISIFAALTCALTLVASPAAVGQTNADWHGQDSEFGTIRAPYATTMEGQRVPVEARVVLRENYGDKDSRFFMFGFLTEHTPLDVQFDNLVRSDTGAELPCYKREGTPDTGIKCFVDLKDMPEPGTEIRMYGTVGSSKTGQAQVGAIVIPMTYTWNRVQMSNGLYAELYASTIVNVQQSTTGDKTLAGIGNKGVPGIGAIGVAAAGVVAVGLIALRRK